MKYKISLLVAVVAVLVIAGFFVKSRLIPLSGETPTSTANISQGNWIVYANTKYNYGLKYPDDVYIQQISEMEPPPITESAALEMGRRGTSDVGIEIRTLVPHYGTSTPSNQYNETVKGDLVFFAEASRQKFADDKNPNFPNMKIGELEKITFAGRAAYAATVTGYTDGHTGDTFRYVYAENGNYKLAIQYSLKGDLSKQIVDTFQFSK